MDLRQYDVAIGRWIAIDPITHHSQSTYAAFDNNPVFWADPSGAATGFAGAVEQHAGGAGASKMGNTGSDPDEEEESAGEGSTQKDPKVFLFSSNGKKYDSSDRISLIDVSGQEDVVRGLMSLWPDHDTFTNGQVTAEGVSLLISIFTAGMGNTRFSKLGGLSGNVGDAVGIGNIQIFPMGDLVNESEALTRLVEYENAISGGPYKIGDYAINNNLVLIFSENSLFDGNNYNETSNINNVDYFSELIDPYSQNDAYKNVHYMHLGIDNGKGLITIINKIKLNK